MIERGFEDVDYELQNWALWGHVQTGPQALSPPSIWDAWLNFKGRVAGWGLTLAEKEAEARGERIEVAQEMSPQPIIDDTAAARTDANMTWLRHNDKKHFAVLHKHYYRWQRVSDHDLHAALLVYRNTFPSIKSA